MTNSVRLHNSYCIMGPSVSPHAQQASNLKCICVCRTPFLNLSLLLWNMIDASQQRFRIILFGPIALYDMTNGFW